jgi:hypothetical protein
MKGTRRNPRVQHFAKHNLNAPELAGVVADLAFQGRDAETRSQTHGGGR